MPGRDNPCRVFLRRLRACVRAPSKRDSSHEIRERTKRKSCRSAEGIIQLCSGIPCYFPVPVCYFRRFRAFTLISLQICILPAPIYRDLQGPRTESGGNHRRYHQGGQRRRCWGDAPLLGSLYITPVSRNAPDVPELIVLHINFIRIMINALDRGELVLPKGSDVANEIDEYVRIIRGRALEKVIDSAPAAGKARIAPR